MSRKKRAIRAVLSAMAVGGALTGGLLASTWQEYLFFGGGLVVGAGAMWLDASREGRL